MSGTPHSTLHPLLCCGKSPSLKSSQTKVNKFKLETLVIGSVREVRDNEKS